MPESGSMASGMTRDEAAYAKLPHSCARCTERWNGTRPCHCSTSGCHRTFTGLTAFDEHRKGGECVDPSTIGMVLRERTGYQLWGYEMDDETADRFRAMHGSIDTEEDEADE